MSKWKGDVLERPDIVRRTERLLAITKRIDDTNEKLADALADAGDELIAAKEALDKTPDRTAWTRWLKLHVHYEPQRAREYMSLARLRKKTPSARRFFKIDKCRLIRIASVPDHILKTLKPDTLLKIPGTTKQKPLEQMFLRELDDALDAIEGKKPGERTIKTMTRRIKAITQEVRGMTPHALHLPKEVKEDFDKASKEFVGEEAIETQSGTDGRSTAKTREELAAELIGETRRLAAKAALMKSLPGKLKGTSKQMGLDAIELYRRSVVPWPAWARPLGKSKKKS